MRRYKAKTNIEVNGQKGDGGIKNHGVNDFMARKNPIQGASYTASPSEVERRKEENKVHDMSQTFLASGAPELLVFIQESDYQSIKDIFIDREVPSRNRLKYKGIYSKYNTDVNGDSEEPGKSLSILSSISNEIEQDFQNYARKRHALEDLMKDDDDEDSDGRDVHSHDKTTMSNLEEFLQGSECQQPHKTEGLLRSLRGPSQSIINEMASGDCGSIAASPIPCSGSMSLRSSSSTASSHSFAFPILPTEWNGSPVRMAEADPRRPKKHQRSYSILMSEYMQDNQVFINAGPESGVGLSLSEMDMDRDMRSHG
ncbi:hypothetical protein Gohar_014821 [Gossypium harknessii]|uniref:Uncharacterized protein n=1 Tax=Gossypium harknessii TaxID=34285 RepID=A0A7J9FXX6_9ROSI|nr:hypothetical protein [Gossypium harknessii]